MAGSLARQKVARLDTILRMLYGLVETVGARLLSLKFSSYSSLSRMILSGFTYAIHSKHSARHCHNSNLESGAWHTLVDHADSYLEASATAGFAYGILKAVLRRYIDSQYRVVGEKAIQYVLHNVDETGELQQTSYGTPMGHDLQFYKNTPLTLMPYGQAMAIMALGEYLWTYF
ncbi:hypothetical protein VI817_002461 [Penicillium citrinum]|nr:hypothetical protein VI817_002461 [Penicillium citrinum]